MWSKFQALPCYFGGKRKLVKDIFNHARKDNGVFIDAFLGGGSVSLYAKAKGYKVIANDIALRSYITGKVFIENNRIKLTDEDLARLFIETKHDGFIKKNFCPKVFVSKTADFLDKYAERTNDGVLHRELIGVYKNYQIKFGSASMSDYADLWDKLTEAEEFHTVVVPDGDGTLSFTAYFAGIKSELARKKSTENFWKNLTVNFIAKSPAAT